MAHVSIQTFDNSPQNPRSHKFCVLAIRYLPMTKSSAEADSEVRVFSSDNVNTLLLGKQPIVGPERRHPQTHRTYASDGADFSKFSFPPEIEPSVMAAISRKPDASHSNDVTARIPPPNYTRLRHDSDEFDAIVSYLDVYSKNNKRKVLSLHGEMEDRYLQPFSRRLARKVSGPGYERFIDAKSRAVSAFDTATRAKDTFNRPLPAIPHLRVTQSGLRDPIQKYKTHTAVEQRLVKTISESMGVPPDPPKPERDTMNLKKWGTLAETRFYDGGTTTKGKRVDPHHFGSRVGAVLDAFAPPEQIPRRPRAPRSMAAIDHISFDA
jgi:hypothetical protein